MSRVAHKLARQQLSVARPSSFDLERPDAELRRLADAGTVLRLAKGLYALVPEHRRTPNTTWLPTIEGAALGIAAAFYNADAVALIGPSAVRAHRCYPRALGVGYVATPRQRRERSTVIGTITFVQRDIHKLDTVRIETDLGPGWATSVEQTALDLTRNRPAWNITEATRLEMINRLADRIDWELIEEVAAERRGVATLARLHRQLNNKFR